MNTKADILHSFITDEEDALRAGRNQGHFWTMNHHRIGPLVPQAGKLLAGDQAAIEALYFHIMRRTGGIPVHPKSEPAHLVAAYQKVLPIIDTPVLNALPRHTALYVFGFDDTGTLPDAGPSGIADFISRMKLVAQTGKYSTMPAQRKAQPRFEPFLDDAPRVLHMLQHLNYRHDRRYPHRDDIYNYTDLRFWGFFLITLMAATTRADALEGFLKAIPGLPKSADHLEVLHAYVEAIVPRATPNETRFMTLREQLARQV